MSFVLDNVLVAKQKRFYGEVSGVRRLYNAYPSGKRRLIPSGSVHFRCNECCSCGRAYRTISETGFPACVEETRAAWVCYDCTKEMNEKPGRAMALFKRTKTFYYWAMHHPFPRDIARTIMGFYFSRWSRPFPLASVRERNQEREQEEVDAERLEKEEEEKERLRRNKDGTG